VLEYLYSINNFFQNLFQMTKIYLLITSVILCGSCALAQTGVPDQKPRVFIFTDINLVGGDPDDRQSLVHLLWYADELDIVGIVPDYWKGKGIEACQQVLEAYNSDYLAYNFEKKGFPSMETAMSWIIKNEAEATARLVKATESNEPLYVLIWGQMTTFMNILFQYPEISNKVRILTIGTGVKYGPKDEVAGEDCTVVNWNGRGRNEIYNDPRYNNMWWIESNWTYNGMFEGNGPKVMFEKLSVFGKMGLHIKEVTINHDWAQYFRVGDTPTVLYLIDPGHDIENPEIISWAGKFKKPFPDTRPHYYTDDNGTIEWNYENPCLTWVNLKEMYTFNKSTLALERADMYEELLKKLKRIYAP
jgi:hypothetical protein